MKVLVVKLTSMGDVLHLMPALSDLSRQHVNLKVDWMVEDSFAQIPHWHPNVDRVINVGTRRWRKFNWSNIKEFFTFLKELRSQRYDIVVDAQGLMKSAVLAKFAKLQSGGQRIGFSGDSIKESPAAKLYSKKVVVDRQQHAIERLRQLFAGGFEYSLPVTKPDYALSRRVKKTVDLPTVFLLHGTTWSTKHVPKQLWRNLAELIIDDGYKVALCWGNDVEKHRAEWIAHGLSHANVLPKSSLTELKKRLAQADGAIAVDTGLGHLAAGLGLPCVSLYGATDAKLTGSVGENQLWVQSAYPCSPCLLKECPKITDQVTQPPCYQEMNAVDIWQALYEKIA